MKLGTKLTIYLSLLIILALGGYGYFHVVSRRDTLMHTMKVEAISIGQTLKLTLEGISLLREREYVQDLIDSVEKSEKTLGVLVYQPDKKISFASQSLDGENEPVLTLILKSIQEKQPLEEFGNYKNSPAFSYAFPFSNRKGTIIGGIAIVQTMSFVEKEIQKAKWTIFLIILGFIGATELLLLFITRKWINVPISQLMSGIQQMAKGKLETRIGIKGRDEIAELARAFNQMACDLQKAREEMIREAENKLELERSLRHSEKLATIGQLASELAHEIGTPLNIIGGRAELAIRSLEDRETALANLENILRQTQKITKIIQQLLGFARKKKPEQIPLAVPGILESILDLLGQQLEKQGIRVLKEIQEGLPETKGDPDQLQQVFLNLILNAVQAMPGGGTLRLAATEQWISKDEGGEAKRLFLEVAVGDSGPGMDPQVMESIFDPFFTTKPKGTGLGLTVCQGIVQEHEGWIRVESRSGEGSIFHVYLPCPAERKSNDAAS